MHRHIVIGDVHGMLAELRQLILAVGPTPADTVVFCGDLLDKGPDSPGVVRFARELGAHTRVILVQGNHEEKHARYRKAVAKSGGRQPDMKNVAELAAITAGLSPEDIAFLDSAIPFYRIPEHNAVVVHAGIPPTVQDLDALDKGEQQKLLRVRYVTGRRQMSLTIEIVGLDHLDHEPEVNDPVTLDQLMASAGSDLDARIVKKVVRPKGDFIQLGQEGPGDPYWAEVYDGRFGHVYFGHEPFTTEATPKMFPHATGLDLGCVFGGRLAAIVLEAGKPPEAITVKATGKFATGLWEE